MEAARRFEDLWVWQQARELVKGIYQDFHTAGGARDFGFRDQIQRAAVSIMNNLAEGFERSTDADFARFLDVAKDRALKCAACITRQKISVTLPPTLPR